MEYRVENETVLAVSGEVRTPLDIPAPVLAVERQGTRLYVARGSAGVVVYDVSEALAPKLVSENRVSGSAVGFNVIEGQIWVMVVSRSAQPLDDASPAVRPATPPLAGVDTSGRGSPEAVEPDVAEEPDSAPIALRKVGPGTVQLAAGTNQGVRVGDRYSVYRRKEMQGADRGAFTGEEIIALLEVVAVKEDSSLAEVSRSALVQNGDWARPSRPDQTESNYFPTRVPHVGEVSMVLRPIVNSGSPLGFGALAEIAASYWGNSYFAGVRLNPLGVGWSEDGNIVSTAALAEGGFDGRVFSVGLGVGMSWVNGDVDQMLRSGGFTSSDEAGAEPSREETQETNSALTLAQLARLGARDGLHLSIYNLLILHDDPIEDASGFIYGGTTGRLSWPLDRRSDIFVEGGGGVMGYWFAGGGVGTWIEGNGSPGSWKLSISAGAAGIWGSREITETVRPDPTQPAQTYTYTDDVEVSGPMVSIGLARRFAL